MFNEKRGLIEKEGENIGEIFLRCIFFKNILIDCYLLFLVTEIIIEIVYTKIESSLVKNRSKTRDSLL